MQEGGELGVACMEFGVSRFVPITLGKFLFLTKMGRYYFSCQREVTSVRYTKMDVKKLVEVGMLLPMCSFQQKKIFNLSGPAILWWTVVTSGWIETVKHFVGLALNCYDYA